MTSTNGLWGGWKKGYVMQNATMARPKKNNKDRHKPSRMTRIRGRIADQLQRLVDRNETDFTGEVNRAVREMLEREHLWPPSDDAKD